MFPEISNISAKKARTRGTWVCLNDDYAQHQRRDREVLIIEGESADLLRKFRKLSLYQNTT